EAALPYSQRRLFRQHQRVLGHPGQPELVADGDAGGGAAAVVGQVGVDDDAGRVVDEDVALIAVIGDLAHPAANANAVGGWLLGTHQHFLRPDRDPDLAIGAAVERHRDAV